MYKVLQLLLFLTFSPSFAQEEVATDSIAKSNPIIYFEGCAGIGGGNSFNYFFGFNFNYQLGKTDLLTARNTVNVGLRRAYAGLAPVVVIPFFLEREVVLELGILYGKRWAFGNHSLSASAGIAHFNRQYYESFTVDERLNENYFGVPFELNLKFFKARKQRFRAYYGLIPIGKKKVSFGRSVGFKLTGNISKNSSMGIGLTYGFGWHKKY